MFRRLALQQPESFAFTPANLAWAQAQIRKYPEGRQASAIIALFWRAQEQEGWLSRPAIEYVAQMLDMPKIRALEVATFYFQYQLQPVGRIAHVMICGTLSCMICGAEDLMAVCKEHIAPQPHQVSEDGAFSWEEIECIGACANAPLVMIGKDYYEDVSAERLVEILAELRAGKVPRPGSQIGRFSSEPKSGLTTLTGFTGGHEANASVELALAQGDTIKRIDGSEVPLRTPWLHDGKARPAPEEARGEPRAQPRAATPPSPAAGAAPDTAAKDKPAAGADAAKPASEAASPAAPSPGRRPEGLAAAREGGADDLQRIIGIGPKLEELLHSLGVWHFDQIAAWGEEELAWVDGNLEGFHGRASRDRWVAQASALAEGADDEKLREIHGG